MTECDWKDSDELWQTLCMSVMPDFSTTLLKKKKKIVQNVRNLPPKRWEIGSNLLELSPVILIRQVQRKNDHRQILKWFSLNLTILEKKRLNWVPSFPSPQKAFWSQNSICWPGRGRRSSRYSRPVTMYLNKSCVWGCDCFMLESNTASQRERMCESVCAWML